MKSKLIWLEFTKFFRDYTFDKNDATFRRTIWTISLAPGRSNISNNSLICMVSSGTIVFRAVFID